MYWDRGKTEKRGEVCQWGNNPVQVSEHGYDKASLDKAMKKMATRAGGNLLRYVGGGRLHRPYASSPNYWATIHVFSVNAATWVGQHVLA